MTATKDILSGTELDFRYIYIYITEKVCTMKLAFFSKTEITNGRKYFKELALVSVVSSVQQSVMTWL